MIELTVLVVALAAATAVGLIYRARSGAVRSSSTDLPQDVRTRLLDAGASHDAATVLHFSAEWCGPCAAVRRVVHRVLEEVDGPIELELDIDADAYLARALSVMSLPTTFVLDADLVVKARISGVPTADDLRWALADH